MDPEEEEAVRELLQGIQCGDDSALAELYRVFEPSIRHHARVQGRVEEDVIQSIRMAL